MGLSSHQMNGPAKISSVHGPLERRAASHNIAATIVTLSATRPQASPMPRPRASHTPGTPSAE